MDYYAKWLVDTDWLAQHLAAPDVVILDCTLFLPVEKRNALAEFREEHIPGAHYFDIDEIADTNNPLPHMMPSAEKFSARVRKMGIGDGTRVICYDTQNMYSASRVWWMFRVMGHEDVAILNGGLMKWTDEDRPLDSGDSIQRVEPHFTARLNRGLVREFDDMKRIVANNGMQIVDARSIDRFTGKAPEPRDVPRLGHIPGSISLPFTNIVNRFGVMKSPEEIREVFAAAGIDAARPVVATCGSGVTACMIALGLAILGHEHTAVYDGSWAEWSETSEPAEIG
jgi:thiosulfate/3-mercaptopyruvate sulfurtransferase